MNPLVLILKSRRFSARDEYSSATSYEAEVDIGAISVPPRSRKQSPSPTCTRAHPIDEPTKKKLKALCKTRPMPLPIDAQGAARRCHQSVDSHALAIGRLSTPSACVKTSTCDAHPSAKVLHAPFASYSVRI
eukprot:2660135-Pleurochrysis_carterae.AAC.2